MQVPDLETAVATARRLGAMVRIPPMTAAGVTFALVVDPEGNPVGMVERK